MSRYSFWGRFSNFENVLWFTAMPERGLNVGQMYQM